MATLTLVLGLTPAPGLATPPPLKPSQAKPASITVSQLLPGTSTAGMATEAKAGPARTASDYRTPILDPAGVEVPRAQLRVRDTGRELFLDRLASGEVQTLGHMHYDEDAVHSLKNLTLSENPEGRPIPGKSFKNVGTLLWEHHLRTHLPRNIIVGATGPVSGGFHFSLGLRFDEPEKMSLIPFLLGSDTEGVDDLGRLIDQVAETSSPEAELELANHDLFKKVGLLLDESTHGAWNAFSTREQARWVRALDTKNTINQFLLDHKGRLLSFEGVMRFRPETAATVRTKFGVDY